MTTYTKADEKVIKIATRLIGEHHPTLQRARIGFIFRDSTPQSKGKQTLGKAAKVSDQYQPLMAEPLDFLIWISEPAWFELSPSQQVALVDHELCHCRMGEDDVPEIVPHDIEEFRAVVDRHGLWNADLQMFGSVVKEFQPTLFGRPERNGYVVAAEPAQFQNIPA